MATYTIVASTKDPLGPGEIAAGSTIQVSEGDVFIIDPSADAKITFQADGGIPANFDVVINDSNVNTFEISVLSDLTPTVTVADNVDASGIRLGAAASDAVNFTAGDNVQFGGYIGSVAGADTISIGNGFTTTATWSTSGGDDSIIVGDNATFIDIDGGSGNDTISFGDGVTTGKIIGGAGDDSITIGKDATVTSVDGEGGTGDTLNTSTGGLTVSNVETTNYIDLGYISEYQYKGYSDAEFIEIAVPIGTDVSSYTIVRYLSDGTVGETYSLGTLQGTFGGQDVYVIDDNTPGFNTMSGQGEINSGDGLALVNANGNVLQFISHDGNTVIASEGPASGMTSTMVGTTGFNESLQSDDGGATYYVQGNPNAGTIPCYAPGTMIETPDGPRAVETLFPGDLVLTVDHGAQPIRWVRSGDHPLDGAEDDQKPVLVQAGALGSGLPTEDLIVSPQHRILVGGGGQLTAYFDTETFVPAKSLTSLPGIRHMKGKRGILWIHFACARHEVVLANGCQSESLLLGPMAVNGLTDFERQNLTGLFAPASAPDAALNGPPARECLTVGAVRRQLKASENERGHRLAQEHRKWDADLAMELHEAELIRQARSMN